MPEPSTNAFTVRASGEVGRNGKCRIALTNTVGLNRHDGEIFRLHRVDVGFESDGEGTAHKVRIAVARPTRFDKTRSSGME